MPNVKPMSHAAPATAALVAYTLLLMVRAAVPANAQSEFRLSTHGGPASVLPVDIRIQSAASIGSVTMVAWGNARLAPSGMLVPTLVYAMIRDTHQVGPITELHSPEARPFGTVFVSTIGNGFMVFWNDRRLAAPGIYSRRFDTSGTPLGNEERISRGVVTPSAELTMGALGTREYGRLVVWNDSREERPGVYAVHVAPDGRVDIPEQHLGSTFTSVQVSNVGYYSFRRFDDNAVHMIDNAGLIDPRVVPNRFLANTIFIDNDLSLATITKEYLDLYPSLWDSVPQRRIKLKATPTWDVAIIKLPNQRYIVADVLTDYIVRGYRISLQQQLVDSNGTIRTDTLYPAEYTAPTLPRGGTPYISITSYKRVAGCSGDWMFDIEITSGWSSATYGDHESKTHWTTAIYGDGSTKSLWDGGTPDLDLGCKIQLPTVTRASHSDTSTTKVTLGGQTVTVSIAIPQGTPHTQHGRPSISWSTDAPVVGWTELTIDSASSAVNLLSNRPLRQVRTPGGFTPRYADRTNGVIDASWPTFRTTPKGPPPYKAWETNPIFISQNYLSDSWRSKEAKIIFFDTNIPMTERAFAYDANTGNRLIVMQQRRYSNNTNTLTFLIDTSSKIIAVDSMDFHTTSGMSAILFGYRDFVLADAQHGVHYRSGIIIDTIKFSPIDGIAYYQQLANGIFARLILDRNDNDVRGARLTIQLFNERLQQTAETSLYLPGDRHDPTIVEDKEHSTLTLLTAGNGIFAQQFTYDLRPAGNDRQISTGKEAATSPVGTVRSGQMLVVWRMLDNDDEQIRGKYVPVSALSDVVEREGIRASPTNDLRATPNPANGVARIWFTEPVAEPARLDLTTMLGDVVRSVELPTVAGSGRQRSLDLDVSGLPRGLYFVRLRSGNQVSAMKLEIQP